MNSIVFYILAAVILGGGLLAVTSRRIFRAAVYLLFSLIGIAGLYFYLNYEFIGAVQIVVYVGGIIVLMLFSIFLTQGSGEDMKKPVLGRAIFSALATIFGCGMVMSFINGHEFASSAKPALDPSAENIGFQMLNTAQYGYILPFEVVSMLLLASMIACIVIAIKIKVPAHVILPDNPRYHDDVDAPKEIVAEEAEMVA